MRYNHLALLPMFIVDHATVSGSFVGKALLALQQVRNHQQQPSSPNKQRQHQTALTDAHPPNRVACPRFMLALMLVACSALGGCANKLSSDPLMPSMTTQVDLVALLSNGTLATDPQISFASQFEKAVSDFNTTHSPEKARQQRNLIQDRMKVSADQLCDEYKTVLLRKQAQANFRFGAISLFLGSAGALAKGVEAARTLSGSAAFTTGLRSEYNQEFYLDQTVAVIAKAIDQRQTEINDATQSKRSKELADYSVIQAIDDMSRYHSACSLGAALAQMDKAVQSYDVNKSLKVATETKTILLELINHTKNDRPGAASTHSLTVNTADNSTPKCCAATQAQAMVEHPLQDRAPAEKR